MTGEHLTLPEQSVREYAHGLAYKLACEQLASISDIEVIIIDHLNQSYRISFPDGEVTLTTGEEAVLMRDKILILHYFTRAKGTPLSNKMITYKELPDGINYFPVFAKRAIAPIINHFGDELHRLLDIAQILGGHKADYGDIAMTINAFKHVPVTIVLWRGDEEFPPEGNIMFDSTISDYLPTEDITILCEAIAWRLVRL